MIIIGVDYHPEFQQVAWVDTETGEYASGQHSSALPDKALTGSRDHWDSRL